MGCETASRSPQGATNSPEAGVHPSQPKRPGPSTQLRISCPKRSPQNPPKSPNPIKTNQIINFKKRSVSFSQFDKIELEDKESPSPTARGFFIALENPANRHYGSYHHILDATHLEFSGFTVPPVTRPCKHELLSTVRSGQNRGEGHKKIEHLHPFKNAFESSTGRSRLLTHSGHLTLDPVPLRFRLAANSFRIACIFASRSSSTFSSTASGVIGSFGDPNSYLP